MNIGAGFLIGVVVAGATVAVATIPHSISGVITGCYANRNGALRVIDAQAGQTCARGETQISWNQTGPQGPAGDPSDSQYGTLYAGATYRLSVDGCPEGHVKLVRANAAGTNPNFLPTETQCEAPVLNSTEFGESLEWPVMANLTRTDQALLYRGGGTVYLGNQVLGSDAPAGLQGARVEIWIDLYDINSLSETPRMGLTFWLSRSPAGAQPLSELAYPFLLWAETHLMPDPLVFFQVPQ